MAEWTRRQLKDDEEVFADLLLSDLKLVVWQDAAGAWWATLPGYRNTIRPLRAVDPPQTERGSGLEAAQAEALTLMREVWSEVDLALAELEIQVPAIAPTASPAAVYADGGLVSFPGALCACKKAGINPYLPISIPTDLACEGCGGLRYVNPSPFGGTWAYCHVDAANARTAEKAGLILPADVGLPAISNNTSEFAALARCLRALPDGWSGKVYSDSEVTLNRFFGDGGETGLPTGWLPAARANLKRLGALEPVLLGGHPNKAELEAGRRKDGRPVSRHNVWCDQACTAQARAYTNRFEVQP